MKIIHYTLGLPPFRNGGLVNYSIDLAIEQSKENEVILLYPGERNRKKEIKIKFEKNLELVKVYSVRNPLPISIMFGIKNPKDFIESVSTAEFEFFLRKENPDVVHIHTLMGLHKEFVEICNKLKIKTVFTTHDYFGICPKVNLIDIKLINCNNYKNGERCVCCNQNSFDTKILNKMNLGFYIKLRQNQFLNKFKGNIKAIVNVFNKNKFSNNEISNEKLELKGKQYKELREYYFSIFDLIDKFHFNSNVSRKIYENYLNKLDGDVIFITHKNIKKNIILEKNRVRDQLRISFLGNENPIKGLDILLNAYSFLDQNYKNKIKILIYGIEKGIIANKEKNIIFKGKYKYDDLENIFKDTDYTIVPSIWYETFNFVALESKIYNTPVIISNTVGAKDIFRSDEKIEIIPSEKNIKKVFENIIEKEIVLKINKDFEYESFEQHSFKILEYYKK